MMSAKNIAVVLTMLSSCVMGQNGSSTDRAGDQNEIMKAIAEVSQAYVARNPEPFSRVYLENYVSIRGKPVFNTRAQLIAMMKADSGPVRAGKKLDFETLLYESENPQFHFFGRSAIVNIAKKNLWQYRGDKCLTRTQATELWVKADGAWRIAAVHVSTFHCTPRPFYPIHPAVAAIRSLTKAPPNSDQQAETDITEVVGEILTAARSGANLTSSISKHVAEKFVFTGLEGEISNDPADLAKLPPAITSRIPGLRNREETVAIYGDAALYTYRARPPAAPGSTTREPSQQCTIFLVNTQQKWRIAAIHVSGLSTD